MAQWPSNLYSKQQAGLAPAPSPGLGHAVYRMHCVVALTTALAVNDTIPFFSVPAGAKVIDARLASDQLDSNGSPTLVLYVGDGLGNNPTNDIYSGSTVGQTTTEGYDRNPVPSWLDYQYQNETLIQGLVHTAAATHKAGNLYFTVWFTLPGLPSSLASGALVNE